MKKIMVAIVALMSFVFADAAMSATLTLNSIGAYDFTGNSGLNDTAVDPNPDFDITHKIVLNVAAQLAVNSYELQNIVDFISYKLYSDSGLTSLIGQFNFYNTTTGGSGSMSAVGFSTHNLGAGSYFLNITGRVAAAGNGQFSTQATALATPVPGAVWLLGSALMGLVGVSRRKASANGLAA